MKKDNLSWRWNGQLHFLKNFSPGNLLRLEEDFTSNLFWVSRREKKWKDENKFQFLWRKKYRSHWGIQTLIQSWNFSDENTLVKFSKHALLQGVWIQAGRHFRIEPFFGWTFEKIFDHQDNGPYARFHLRVQDWEVAGYRNNTRISSELRAIPGRRNQDHQFWTRWYRKFSDYSEDSLKLGYQFTQSRYYLPKSAAMEQVLINARFLTNNLIYRTSARSRFHLQTQIHNRDIDQSNPAFQNRRKEITISNIFTWEYQGRQLLFRQSMQFGEEINDNPRVETDLNTAMANFQTNVRYQWSQRQQSWLLFSYTKYEYNTPDTVINHDDRDELRFVLDTGHQLRFSDNFQMQLGFNAFLFHQIYIHPSRSANNNWNRIFQLQATFHHRIPGLINHRYRIQILANYTVYDFDAILPQFRSYLFRKMIFTDSLSIRLSPNLALKNWYRYENEDNGTFFKDIFAQRVSKKIHSHFLNVYLEHRHLWGFHIEAGFSFYRRDEWDLLQLKRKIREYRSISPRLTMAYRPTGGLIFYATYAPTYATNFHQFFQYFRTGTVHLTYRF